MEILLEDFFRGFVHNYHTFRLYRYSTGTSWTNRILSYFDQLGRDLGFTVKYEKMLYDLSWYKKGSNNPWFHVEHENKRTWDKLNETINKIHDSVCENLVMIVYPGSQKLWDKFVSRVEAKLRQWTPDSEVLAILDSFYFESPPMKLNGYVFSNLRENIHIRALKKEEEGTKFWYAHLVND